MAQPSLTRPAPAPAPPPRLSPHQNTLEFHWGKHHAAYVNNLNGQIKDKAEWANLSIEEVRAAAGAGRAAESARSDAQRSAAHQHTAQRSRQRVPSIRSRSPSALLLST